MTQKFSKVISSVEGLLELYRLEKTSARIFDELVSGLLHEEQFKSLELYKLTRAETVFGLLSPCPDSILSFSDEQSSLLEKFKSKILIDLQQHEKLHSDLIPEELYVEYIEILKQHQLAVSRFFDGEDFKERISYIQKAIPITNQLSKLITTISPHRNHVSNTAHNAPITSGMIRLTQHLTKYTNIINEIFKIEGVNEDLKIRLIDTFNGYGQVSQQEIENFQGVEDAYDLLVMAKKNYGENLVQQPVFMSLLSLGITKNWCSNISVEDPKNSIKKVWLTYLIAGLLPDEFSYSHSDKLLPKHLDTKVIFNSECSLDNLLRFKTFIRNEFIKDLLNCIPILPSFPELTSDENDLYLSIFENERMNSLKDFIEKQASFSRQMVSIGIERGSKAERILILEQQSQRLQLLVDFSKRYVKPHFHQKQFSLMMKTIVQLAEIFKNKALNFKRDFNKNANYKRRFEKSTSVSDLICLASRKIIETQRQNSDLNEVAEDVRLNLNLKIGSFIKSYFSNPFTYRNLRDQMLTPIDETILMPALGLTDSVVDYEYQVDVNKFNYQNLKKYFEQTSDPVYLVLASCCPFYKVDGLEYIDNKQFYQVTYKDKVLDYLALAKLFLRGQNLVEVYFDEKQTIASDSGGIQVIPRTIFMLISLAFDFAKLSNDHVLIEEVNNEINRESEIGLYLLKYPQFSRFDMAIQDKQLCRELCAKDDSLKGNPVLNQCKKLANNTVSNFRSSTATFMNHLNGNGFFTENADSEGKVEAEDEIRIGAALNNLP